MYDEIFSQITNAANKRNLRDSTIHAYCTSVAHFLKYTDKPIDALTTDDVDTFLTEKRLSGISPETYNHYHSGIRFFYKKVLKMKLQIFESIKTGMLDICYIWRKEYVTVFRDFGALIFFFAAVILALFFASVFS